jgi:hypothetical protein
MPMPRPIEQVRFKIERAVKHFGDLEAEIKLFFDAVPYVVETKRNPDTRQLIYYLASVRETPVGISTIAGDVLQNLRSALDHLAYQLSLVGTGDRTPAGHVYFPIADSLENYEANKLGRLRGMRPQAITAIDFLKPYKGGNDNLWRLHKLNNIDKHRFLITVGSMFKSVNLARHIERMMQQAAGGDPRFANVVVPDLYVTPADRLFPLKPGDELFADAPDAEVVEKMSFQFDVAFGEPEADVNGAPLLETMRGFLDLVDRITHQFEPLV